MVVEVWAYPNATCMLGVIVVRGVWWFLFCSLCECVGWPGATNWSAPRIIFVVLAEQLVAQ